MVSTLPIDDNDSFVDFMVQMLESEGFSVVSAQIEQDAIAIVNGPLDLDLAIVDFWLARSPALKLLETIEEMRPELPVIVVAGGGGDLSLEFADSVACLSGVKDFIQKPFTRDQLISKVHRQLVTPQ